MPTQVVHRTGRLRLDEDGTVHLLCELDFEADWVEVGRIRSGELAFGPSGPRPVLNDDEVEELERAWADWRADLIDSAAERDEWDRGYLADRGVRAAG
jgi:hypothetical protein